MMKCISHVVKQNLRAAIVSIGGNAKQCYNRIKGELEAPQQNQPAEAPQVQGKLEGEPLPSNAIQV